MPDSGVTAHDSFCLRAERACATAVLVVVLGAGLVAQNGDRGRADALARRVNDRLSALQAEADRLATQSRTLLDELRTLEVERQIQNEKAAQAETAVAQHQAAIEDADRRLTALEQQRIAQVPDVKAQLVDIYKRGRFGYARLLFGANTAREFGRVVRAVSALVRINQVRLAEHLRTLDELRRQRAILGEEMQALRTREEDATRARAAAARALAARTAVIADIDARRDVNAQFAGELQLAYDRLQQRMANLDTGRPAEPVLLPLIPFRGMLDWPVAGSVSVRFRQASGRVGDTTIRSGIEIVASEGASVHAVHPGTVSFAGTFAGFGNLVIVDHGANAFSLYGYLDSVSVSSGQAIDLGAEVGLVGSPPAAPPALYFEIRIDGRSVDPVQWLRAR